MALIEGIKIKNYRSLKDVTLGKTWQERDFKPLTPLTVVIGKNGVGKSSLFDAFGFLADCLTYGVDEACHRSGRGGFDRLRSAGSDGNIEFEIYYRESSNERPITYELSIGTDKYGRPIVASERLRQRRKSQKSGRPFSFLELNYGVGKVWSGMSLAFESIDSENEELNTTQQIALDSPHKLGISH
jgi:predicted ATPase